MEEAVRIEKNEGGCMKITINRPDKRNAVNTAVMEGFELALEEARADETVKAVILTGSGEKSFCSGGDIKEFSVLHTESEALGMLARMGEIVYKLAVLPKPTIAFLNGNAFGGGCELAAACDFRYAKKGVSFGFIQGTLGITTGWGGASLLLEKIPPQAAMELLMTSGIFSCEQGNELGFIDYIVSSLQDADDMIEPILERELNVLKSYKKMLVSRMQQNGLKERMKEEINNCAVLWEADAHHIAVESFLNKKNNS
ncbi:enoyl-CoA hydratase/isomerase family protein [Peribacillus sp. B-H-3]|uniref:enoyl-CoA hydratase/isomerase family protein n=1 Tax=Peribacillus sp. B-H-3 TaxID=3400420 RepID=UPI003B01ED8F